MRGVDPSVPTTTREVESNGAQKGYQMPKSFGECAVDDWFTRRHENSFSSFLKTLNETEVSVVHEMLLGKSSLSGNISGSSGQFSDVTESSSGNIGQADGTLESSKVQNKDKDQETKTKKPEMKEIDSDKTKTESKIVKSPEKVTVKEEQKSDDEVVKSPEIKKKKKKHDSPQSPIDECKNTEICVEMCRKRKCPVLNKGASYEAAMKLQKKSSKKKLFDDDSDGEGSDESNAVSKIISKLDSPGKKTKETKGTPKKVRTDEERVMPKKAPKQEIVTTPHKSPCTKPSSSKLSPELVMPDIDWEKVLASEGNKDFYTTVMYQGKPLKIFVLTEEVKIKKKKRLRKLNLLLLTPVKRRIKIQTVTEKMGIHL